MALIPAGRLSQNCCAADSTETLHNQQQQFSQTERARYVRRHSMDGPSVSTATGQNVYAEAKSVELVILHIAVISAAAPALREEKQILDRATVQLLT